MAAAHVAWCGRLLIAGLVLVLRMLLIRLLVLGGMLDRHICIWLGLLAMLHVHGFGMHAAMLMELCMHAVRMLLC